MASQQSNITSTPTPTSTPEQMLLPKSTTAIGMTTSNANPTVSTTTPVITDVVQKCVDTAAEATTSIPTTTAGMTSSQIASTGTTSTTTTIKTATSSSNTVPTMAREAHRYHTVFGPITLVESLTKTNLLLVADVKSELQSMNKQLSKQSAENLETRMEALEQGFIELREVVMQRTINNHLKPNPELLEVWDPSMMVLEKSNWTNMRLILNKTTEDNYPDLFPSEWDHQKLFTEMHEMHYKVFSEVMTAMFHQCGILMDCNIFEMQNYELFLKALHHHLVMGTVNMTQVGHFLILMTYMSFCRLNHYTDYLSDSEEALIEPALWMCLVIISFRSTFHMKETHRTINPYFKVLPTKVKRRLHVIITRYMKQECHCENHIQCDIFPSPLTTEMILPSYQHFIQYLHQKNYTIEGGSIPTESGALNRYAETITMIVLARVNGYYSPHFPMSVMEEEDKTFHNIKFTHAEIDFFTNKLKQAYPKIDTESITNAINFLERQKEANCPCSIHTQKRGYDWIVFNRLPDKISSNTNTTLCSDTEEEDGDFSLTSKAGVHIRNRKIDQSKRNQQQNQKQMNPTRNDVPFSVPKQENTDEEVKSTVDNTRGKTYCYKYFRPYKNDWRLLLTSDSGESIGCTCPKARIHDKKCVWYNPNYINIPDTRNDLSISEKVAQGKIYDIYHHNSQNGQQEPCGCGTAAEIAYMGHKSTCERFQWIHERSSYEWLLANLQKRKKVTLFDNIQQQHKRPRLQSPSGNGKNEDIPKDTKTDVNMDNPSTSATPTIAANSLAVLAEVAQSHSSQSSLSDLIDEQNGGTGGVDCPFTEEMPLEDANSTEL